MIIYRTLFSIWILFCLVRHWWYSPECFWIIFFFIPFHLLFHLRRILNYGKYLLISMCESHKWSKLDKKKNIVLLTFKYSNRSRTYTESPHSVQSYTWGQSVTRIITQAYDARAAKSGTLSPISVRALLCVLDDKIGGAVFFFRSFTLQLR